MILSIIRSPLFRGRWPRLGFQPARAFVRLFLVCAALLSSAVPGFAQVAFEGSVAAAGTGGTALSAPQGAVVDPAGNLYIADTGHNQIVQVPWQGTPAVLAISGATLSAPCGLAMDASGNLYIADSGHGRVVVVSAAGAGTVLATGGPVLSALVGGVAVDGAGSIFIADTSNNRIVKVTSAGVGSVLPLTGLGSSLSSPAGLAVDPSGNLYVADSGHNRVVAVAPAGTAAVVSITGLSPALAAPSGIAVTPSGTLYVADATHDQVISVPETGGAGTALSFSTFSAPLTFTAPQGLAVDSLGQLLVADASNGGRVEQINLRSVPFGHLKLSAPAPLTRTLHFSVTAGTTIDAIAVATLGTANQDFTVTGVPTLATGLHIFAAADATVELAFAPVAPGFRSGALVVTWTNGGSDHTTTIPLYGTSDAPVAAVNPANTTNVAGYISLEDPWQVALDGAGNLYVASYRGSEPSPDNLVKIPAAGGNATDVTTNGYTLGGLAGVAVDGSGNLYLADSFNNKIVKVAPSGTATALTITVNGSPSSIASPATLALDGDNDLFIADYGNGRVLKLRCQDGVTSYTASVVGTGGYPLTGTRGDVYSIAVDAGGTLYIADAANNRILKVTPGGATSVLATPGLTPALSTCQGVGVDPMGNVYIADNGNHRIVRVTTAGVATVLSMAGWPYPPTPLSLTVDSLGNVFAPDCTLEAEIVKMVVAGGALSFPVISVGSSALLTATVANLGDEDLAVTGVSGFNRHFLADTLDTSLITSGTTLTPGAVGDVAVTFAPQATGSLSSNLVVIDNDQNIPGFTQAIATIGYGQLIAPTGQASGLAFSSVGATQLTASWSRGGGAACAVFIAQASTGQAAPASAGSCTANPAFGAGGSAGAGWYCVYNGTGTSVTVTGLSYPATYRVFVSEYETAGGVQAYNTSSGSGNLANQATAAMASFSVAFGTDGTAGATLTGSTSQNVPSGGAASAVTAVAPGGYAFVNWTGTQGFATCASNPLSVSDVTAAYAITAHFAANAGSSPGSSTIVITTPSPVLTVRSTGGTSATSITLGTVGSVPNPVTLTASGLPAGATCAFDSSTVDLSAGPATVGVTITMASPFRIIGRHKRDGRNPLGFGLGAGAFLACGVLASGRRRKRFGLFLSILLLVLVGGLTACSSHNGIGAVTDPAATQAAAGTYTFVITASSKGVAAATTSFKLILN